MRTVQAHWTWDDRMGQDYVNFENYLLPAVR